MSDDTTAVDRRSKEKMSKIQHVKKVYPYTENFRTRAWFHVCTIGESIYRIFTAMDCESWLDFTD